MDSADAEKLTKTEKIVKFNRVLVDTCVLFGIFHKTDPFHGMSIGVLRGLRDRFLALERGWDATRIPDPS